MPKPEDKPAIKIFGVNLQHSVLFISYVLRSMFYIYSEEVYNISSCVPVLFGLPSIGLLPFGLPQFGLSPFGLIPDWKNPQLDQIDKDNHKFGQPLIGGSQNGRSPIGGSPNGGSPNGGSPIGGSPNGGSPNGGSPNGSSPNGSSPNGGSPIRGSSIIKIIINFC